MIGSGPMLDVEGLIRLENEITFASDEIIEILDTWDWRPSFYTISNCSAALRLKERSRQLQSLMLLPKTLRSLNCAGPRTLWYEEKHENPGSENFRVQDRARVRAAFASDVSDGVQTLDGCVMFSQLQLALHMGCSEVYLMSGAPVTGDPEYCEWAFRSASGVYESSGGRIADVSVRPLIPGLPHFDLMSVLRPAT